MVVEVVDRDKGGVGSKNLFCVIELGSQVDQCEKYLSLDEIIIMNLFDAISGVIVMAAAPRTTAEAIVSGGLMRGGGGILYNTDQVSVKIQRVGTHFGAP